MTRHQDVCVCVPANHVAYTGGTAYIIIVAVEHFEHKPERERERERERGYFS